MSKKVLSAFQAIHLSYFRGHAMANLIRMKVLDSSLLAWPSNCSLQSVQRELKHLARSSLHDPSCHNSLTLAIEMQGSSLALVGCLVAKDRTSPTFRVRPIDRLDSHLLGIHTN